MGVQFSTNLRKSPWAPQGTPKVPQGDPKCRQMRHGFDNMFQNAVKCDMVSTTSSKMLSNATWFRQHVPNLPNLPTYKPGKPPEAQNLGFLIAPAKSLKRYQKGNCNIIPYHASKSVKIKPARPPQPQDIDFPSLPSLRTSKHPVIDFCRGRLQRH